MTVDYFINPYPAISRLEELKEGEPSCKRRLFTRLSPNKPEVVHDSPMSVSGPAAEPIYSELDTSDEEDYQHRFGEQREEAAMIRGRQASEAILLKQSYGLYTDSSPAIVQETVPHIAINAIEKLSPVDRSAVKSYIGDLTSNEHAAIQTARQFRRQASKIEQEYLAYRATAHQEKESIRYFWRQQLLEGCSRSGQIVRKALTTKTKCALDEK